MFGYVRLTLIQVIKGNEILLGMKKRGLGVGKWNGFGGKLNVGETLKQCAARELHEECSLTVKESDLKQIGIIIFEMMGDKNILEVNVFRAEDFTGTPIESEEMCPKWFPINDVPFNQMWADDKIWYPLMFNRDLFFGVIKFHGHDNMISEKIQIVQNVKVMEQLKIENLKEQPIKINKKEL